MFKQQNTTSTLGIIIAILAGAWTLVHIILGIAGIQANDYWGVALLILFLLAVIVAFMQYAQERPALKATTSTERFPEPAISKFFFGS